MFNRSSFNKTAFNKLTSVVSPVIYLGGTTRASVIAEALRLNLSFNIIGSSAGSSGAGGYFSIKLQFGAQTAAASEGLAEYIRGRYVSALITAISTAQAIQLSGYDEEIMSFTALGMAPGDELVIDTENMTVLLNGENALNKLTDESAFFTIEKGTSIAVERQGTADVTIIWKDRWF